MGLYLNTDLIATVDERTISFVADTQQSVIDVAGLIRCRCSRLFRLEIHNDAREVPDPNSLTALQFIL